MRMLSHLSAATLVAVFALALNGCGKKEEVAAPAPAPAPAVAPAAPDVVNVPVSVKLITLSNKIDAATKQAAAPMSTFAPGDTIYAVVETIGSGKTSMKALWTYHKGDQSAQVDETVLEITPTGPASTEFHISKPGGWPLGDYQLEIFLNGVSAGTQKFSVQ